MESLDYWGRFRLGARAINTLLHSGTRSKEELFDLGPQGLASKHNAGDKTINEIWRGVFGEIIDFRKRYHPHSDTARGTIIKTRCPGCGRIMIKKAENPRRRARHVP